MEGKCESDRGGDEVYPNTFGVGMCLEENYSDSPSNEYSRHYSAESESEYLRRQNMNSKLGEQQKKKGRHVRRSRNFDSNSDKKQNKGQNDNGLILGRVSINTRTRHIPTSVTRRKPDCKWMMMISLYLQEMIKLARKTNKILYFQR